MQYPPLLQTLDHPIIPYKAYKLIKNCSALDDLSKSLILYDNYNFIKHLQQSMKDDECAINNRESYIYKKVPGSKSTWEFLHTASNYMNISLKDIHYNIEYKKLENMLQSNDSMYNGVKMQFKRISVNYNLIEYGDFYFNIKTKRVKEECKEEYACVYYSDITLTNVKDKMTEFINNSIIIKELKDNDQYNLNTLNELYTIILEDGVINRVDHDDRLLSKIYKGMWTWRFMVDKIIKEYPLFTIFIIGCCINNGLTTDVNVLLKYLSDGLKNKHYFYDMLAEKISSRKITKDIRTLTETEIHLQQKECIKFCTLYNIVMISEPIDNKIVRDLTDEEIISGKISNN